MTNTGPGRGFPSGVEGELYTLDDIISQDPIMIALKERCALIANNDSPVLLYGETGTGKELFAQSLHTCSHRAKKPFYLPELRGDPGIASGRYLLRRGKRQLHRSGKQKRAV